MKSRKYAKIGTHSLTLLVLWNNNQIEIGDTIVGMPYRTYDSLHSSVKRLKSCQYWEKFRVTGIDPILFVDII